MAINDGLAGHWSATLNPTQTGNLVDLSGNGNDLNIAGGTGNAYWLADSTAYGGTWCIKSDDDTDYGIAPNQDQGSANTIAIWLRREDTGTVIDWGQESAQQNRWQIRSGGTTDGPRGRYADTVDEVLSNLNLQSNVWSLVAMVTDATTRWDIYCSDGVVMNKYSAAIGGRIFAPKTGISGYVFSSEQGDQRMAGRYDTIRWYNRALSDAEITELWNAGRNEDGLGPGPGPDFQAAWAQGATRVKQ